MSTPEKTENSTTPSGTIRVVPYLLDWPLYVDDNGKVTCHHEECGNDYDIEVHQRRVSVAEYLQAIHSHVLKHHSL